jgi:hypothetical protein
MEKQLDWFRRRLSSAFFFGVMEPIVLFCEVLGCRGLWCSFYALFKQAKDRITKHNPYPPALAILRVLHELRFG